MQRYVGAVDIGGTKIAVGVVDAEGTVVAQRKLLTQGLVGSSVGLPAIAEALRESKSACRCELTAIGIGCTGPVDPISGTIGKVALLPGWEGCAIVAELNRHFGLPTAMENDADAGALAEYRWGNHGHSERFLYVTVSTGIGAGLLIDGSVYRGAYGTHPEIGHHSIDPCGPLCYCGARGCWESLCSGTAIASAYVLQCADDQARAMNVDARVVFERAAAQEVEAQTAIGSFADRMSIALSNLITLYAPDRIVLGGGVSQSFSPLLPEIEARARRKSCEVPVDVGISIASLGSDVGLTGAAAVGFALAP